MLIFHLRAVHDTYKFFERLQLTEENDLLCNAFFDSTEIMTRFVKTPGNQALIIKIPLANQNVKEYSFRLSKQARSPLEKARLFLHQPSQLLQNPVGDKK